MAHPKKKAERDDGKQRDLHHQILQQRVRFDATSISTAPLRTVDWLLARLL